MSNKHQRISPQRSIRGAARDLIYKRAAELIQQDEIREDELRSFRAYADLVIRNSQKLTSAIRPVIDEVEN